MVPRVLWLASKLPAQVLRVLCEVDLGFGVAALLDSVTALYKMAWVPHQSQAGLGVPAVVTGTPHVGEPDVLVPGTPEIISVPHSSTHTYHPCLHMPLSPFYLHSLPLYLYIFSSFFSSVGLAYLVFLLNNTFLSLCVITQS